MGNLELTPDQIAQRNEQVKRAIDDVTSGLTPLQAQRGQAWDKMAEPIAGGPAPCRVCGQKTVRALNHGVCRECFVSGVAQDAARANPPPEPTGDLAPPQCGFCGRVKLAPGSPPEDPAKFLTDAEGMVRGAGGAFICQSCAFAVAGCAGARDAQQARRMMAVTKLQAEAAARTEAIMELTSSLVALVPAEKMSSESAASIESLANAAKLMASIALGDV